MSHFEISPAKREAAAVADAALNNAALPTYTELVVALAALRKTGYGRHARRLAEAHLTALGFNPYADTGRPQTASCAHHQSNLARS